MNEKLEPLTVDVEPTVEQLAREYHIGTLRVFELIERNRIARMHTGEPNQSSEWLDKVLMAIKEKK